MQSMMPLLLLVAFLTQCYGHTAPFGPDKNGLGRKPPMGWNTWCTGPSCYQEGNTTCNGHPCTKIDHDVCSEEMVKSVAQDMIDTGLRDAGYRWVNLDDCWENVTRSDDGLMVADPRRFPSGTLKELATWLHERNFSFGMYTSVGQQTCSTGARTVPGNPTARGVPGSCSDVSFDKMSGKKCYENYKRDAETFASWGVDYIKLDYCSKYPNRADVTGHFRKAINSTGRPMWLNFHCDGEYADWCAEDGNSWRCGKDHHDNWGSTAGVIQTLATAAKTSGPYRWADPDFLTTGGGGCNGNLMNYGERCPGQTSVEYRTEFSLWAISSAPLIVATDLRKMSPIQKEILFQKELIEINQDEMGQSHGRVGKSGAVEVWAKTLSDGTFAVALYNPTEQTSGAALDFDMVPDCHADSMHVWDVWDKKDLGLVHKSVKTEVQPHASVVLRLRR